MFEKEVCPVTFDILLYNSGVGIEKDINKAIYWYEQSAKQGDEDAKRYLEILKKGRK